MVARQMNPAASILLAKSGLPLGALGSLAAQRSIGASSMLTAQAIMTEDVVTIRPDSSIQEAIELLLKLAQVPQL